MLWAFGWIKKQRILIDLCCHSEVFCSHKSFIVTKQRMRSLPQANFMPVHFLRRWLQMQNSLLQWFPKLCTEEPQGAMQTPSTLQDTLYFLWYPAMFPRTNRLKEFTISTLDFSYMPLDDVVPLWSWVFFSCYDKKQEPSNQRGKGNEGAVSNESKDWEILQWPLDMLAH